MQIKPFLRKNIKAILIATITLICLVSYIYITSHNRYSEKKQKRTAHKTDCSKTVIIPDSVLIVPTNVLNDKNDVHLAYAQAYGLQKLYTSNLEFEEDSAEMVKEQKLVHIKNNPLYHVKELKHSFPFIIPEMADLLNEIAFRFKQKLPKGKKNDFLFVVTSALRTNETQFDLSKCNRNAAPISAHLFGTTVDISYKDFYNTTQDSLYSDFDCVQALTKAMQELRQECKLAVVRERRQACFHTTVIPCPPKH
ncbi:conserved hypothetical protein [uncultured Paludibacter sp.]|nr:conserved hypothetical protein [uncultured Paludibacter sp.]